MAEFDPKKLKEHLKQLEKQSDLQSKITKSAAEYASHMLKISELQKNITHIAKTLEELKKEETKRNDAVIKQEKIIEKLKGKVGKSALDNLKKLKEELGIQSDKVALVNAELVAIEKIKGGLEDTASEVKRINILWKEGLRFLEKTPGLVKQGFGKLRQYGLFEMDKAIRMAGVEMGLMASQGTAFGQDIIKASHSTQKMGVHVKDLAKMQSTYSSELGRSVMLSQEGFEAIASMSQGTILGAEGAASLVVEMDRFNVSAKDTGKIIEDTTNMSAKMGLNAGKVIKNLQDNLKMANKYHFKGGIEGMTKMAAQATKFNMSMETTAQFADKLFDIEGAVEMAAKLNTMGGEWSKLGDPMKLMYQARNDMQGLQTDIIDATSGMADFNEKTGEFSFSGLEMHRMRELEKITGISAEQMAEMAKSKAKFSMINAKLGMDVDDDMKDFIENSSVFEDGEYKIKLSGEDGLIPIDKLNAHQKKQMKHDSKTLKERAINSQTFEDQLINMLENTKTLLLPLLTGLNNTIPKIQKAFDGFMESGLADALKSSAETIGFVLEKAIGLFIEYPKVITAIGLALMGPGKWILNGLALAKGFLMGGGGAGGGVGGAGGGASKLFNTARTGAGMSKMGKMGMNFKGAARSGGAIGGGVIAAGMSGYNEWNENSENGMAGGENTSRTLMRGGGAGLGAWGGAAAGAAIGSVVPVIGTLIGGVIGGILGGMAGDAVGDYAGDAVHGATEVGSYNPSAGKNVTGMKYGGMITEPINGIGASGMRYKFGEEGVKERVTPVGKSNLGTSFAGGGGTSNIKISFDTIKVQSDDGSSGKLDLGNDSAFMAMLATQIKGALSTNANGGVMSPNPS